jgi:hypothetical protein
MKIEIKPFNDHARFIPSITFIRLKKRTGAAEPAHQEFGCDTHGKISTSARIF